MNSRHRKERNVSSQESQPENSLVPENATPPATQLAVIAIFALVVILAPFIAGEVYPYTTNPLFQDQPTKYAEYRVFDSDRRPLPVESFALQLEYDGNPVGQGVGILPPITANEFGVIEDEQAIRKHVRRLMGGSREEVIVQQKIYGAVDDQRVGLVEENQWTITRD